MHKCKTCGASLKQPTYSVHLKYASNPECIICGKWLESGKTSTGWWTWKEREGKICKTCDGKCNNNIKTGLPFDYGIKYAPRKRK